MRRSQLTVLTPVALAALSLLAGSGLLHLDALAAGAVLSGASVPLLPVGFGLAELGGTDVALPLTVLFAAVLVALRLGHLALALVGGVAATQGLVALAKDVVARPRPVANELIADAGGYSFPSGHSATAAALFGSLALVALLHARRGLRVALATLALGAVAAIGLSRVVLAAHYPSDVIAGWLLGGAVSCAFVVLAHRLRPGAASA